MRPCLAPTLESFIVQLETFLLSVGLVGTFPEHTQGDMTGSSWKFANELDAFFFWLLFFRLILFLLTVRSE